MAEDPQVGGELRTAARHLLQRPLTCAEHDPEVFALVRRHEEALDRWFTQRLGYRLQTTSDTARLVKGGLRLARPLRATSGRPFHQLEHVVLALTLAATVAGPAVVSLRDLVDQVRAAAADAEVDLADDGTQRRAQVMVLRWMVDHGLADELHDRVDAYSDDAEADAVLRMRPDRIALLPLAAMVDLEAGLGDRSADAGDDAGAELLARTERRSARRTWLRARLVEEPVVHRHDLDDEEWDELRRRQAEEAVMLEEMFGLVVEARAEGVAAIDPAGTLTEVRFPSTGTVGHAALLLIGALGEGGAGWVGPDELVPIVAGLAEPHAKRWKGDLVARPDLLLRQVVDLLLAVGLAEVRPDDGAVRLLPAAARFRQLEERAPASAQGTLL